MLSKIISVLILLTIQTSYGKKYDNYALYKAVPVTVDHIKFLHNIEEKKYMDLKFWRRPQKLFEEVHCLVSPRDESVFLERAKHFGMETELIINNIQEAFDAQTIKQYVRLHVETYEWDAYHSFQDIDQWLADIAIRYPKYVVLEPIGKSIEGRNIYVLGIISANNAGTVIIEGGVHGNEWISSECVTYFAQQILLAKEEEETLMHNIANTYSWYFIPVVNPDGYDYSQTTDRMWQKNRRPTEDGVGVNLNRNFDYNFGKEDSSNDTKDDYYCGEAAVSEPEVQAVTDFITKKSRRLRFYFSFHAYGQKIIIPFGDRIKHVENFGEMENYAKQAILKMYKMYGVKYTAGTHYDTLGIKISGNSASWVKQAHKVKYVFTFLLRDNGSFGYALPPSQIIPTCEEIVAGITEIMTARPRRLRANIFKSQASVLISCSNYVFIVLVSFSFLLQMFVD